MNVYDSQRIAAILKSLGYAEASSLKNADLVILNTCHIREKAAEKVFSDLGRIELVRQERAAEGLDTVIGVVGCVVQAEDDQIAKRAPYVDFAAGPLTYHRLPEILAKVGRRRGHTVIDTEFPVESKFDFLPDNQSAGGCSYLAIQEGCNNFCTYCVVPYTRGVETSRPVEDIIREAKRLVEGGTVEINLLGQNVNSYRYERPDGTVVDFPALLALVAQSAEGMRVRFTTSHPKDMSDETLRIIAAYPNVCRHIHLPVQSGSNRILKLMNRKYTREWYLDRIAAIRRILPDCGITTDMFSGFHSETDADFEETLDLMREVGFDSSFLFKYSERPGTYASKHLPDDIPEEVKIARLQRMIDLQNELSLESNRKDIGKEFEVLVEGFSKRSREQLFGRTSQNKVVVFDKGSHRIGEFVRVKVNDASSATLLGEALE